MREIIDKLIDGVFEYDIDKLLFDVPVIEAKVSSQDLYEGTIEIQSESGRPVKAFVYPGSLRIKLNAAEFNADKFTLEYVFDPTGLEAGDEVSGDIRIVSSAGEYYLPYEFSILSAAGDSKVSGVRNLFHFTNLAQMDFSEATDIFYTPDFIRVFDGNDKASLTKYRGLSAVPGDRQAVEDFLISINKKSPVELITEKSVFEFTEVTSRLKCEIVIRKSTWGYVSASIESDAYFLTTEKDNIHNEDFESGEYRLTFYIEDEELHEGKNYGVITIKTVSCELKITVIAMQRSADKARRAVRKEQKSLMLRLMNCYIRFRTKQLNVGGWVRESMKIVERMNLLDDKNPISRLFQAQLLIVEGRSSEAKWILDHVYNEMKIIEHDDECYAYYLYLTTLIKRDDQYVNDVTARINSYYAMYPTSMPILWMLIYLDEEMSASPSKKLAAIEKSVSRGVHSPILLVEAYNVLVSNPSMLSKLSNFEIEVLNFAVKNGKISRDIIRQLSMLALRTRDYSERLYKLLAATYDLYNDPELVEAICSMLIRANLTDTRFHRWYSEGVKLELKITRLYEYFMYSSPCDLDDGVLPKSVIMYFGFQNRLHYEKKAYIYANIITYRNKIPELYDQYFENMLVFAIEQVLEEHISRHLAIVYEDVLSLEYIKPNMANKLASIIFAKELTVDKPDVKYAVIVQDEFTEEFKYPVVNGISYPRVYSRNFSLFFEDESGKRSYVNREELKDIINENTYVHAIKRYVTGNLPFFLYLCEGKRHYISVEEDNADFCRDLVESEYISASLKSEIRISLLQYYFDNDIISTLDEFLLGIDVKELSARERADLVEFLVKRGLHEQAYEILTVFGDELVPVKSCLKICSHMIERSDGSLDTDLLMLSYNAFKNGKHDLNTLQYLVDNYGGFTKELRNIWSAAKSFDVQCNMLTEKLIIQMLFTRTLVGEKEVIFEDYLAGGPSTRVGMAYLSYAAYDYFVKERITDKSIFEQLISSYRHDEPLNDGCKLALLKYFAEYKDEITEKVKMMLIDFIQEFLHRNIYFKFFAEFSDIVPELSAFTSALFIEYRTNPKARVVLHYILADDEEDVYRTEEMRNMYGGIFSKEFMLFFGEKLQYYVTEEHNGREMLTLSDSVSVEETITDGNDSRYNILNSMVVSKTLHDDATLMDLMIEYMEEDAFAQRVFNIV